MDKRNFASEIINWYESNKRNLPWRETSDPYKIWLSEVILQQTRVAQGLPYYLRFCEKFPNVSSLARAPEQEVLRLWQGLGYYSRARNLHRCAKMIVEVHAGKFPHTYDELLKLPGIGSYTAAAIASISFREPVAVVDGNVFRVLARVFGYDADIASPQGKKLFFAKANELISRQQPDIYNQAIMEFGALYCTPQNPDCANCIFAASCVANRRSLQAMLPVKLKKTIITKRYLHYFIIRHKNKMLMRRRDAKDIWQGLYDFFIIETTKPLKQGTLLSKSPFSKLPVEVSEKVKHILSHQHLYIQFVEVTLPTKKEADELTKESPLKWYSTKEVQELPKPIVINRFLEKSGFFDHH